MTYNSFLLIPDYILFYMSDLIMRRNDIFCATDSINYNCVIATNSETPYVTVNVTIPELQTITITYNSSSQITEQSDPRNHFGMDTYIFLSYFDHESGDIFIMDAFINVTLMNGTEIECITEGGRKEAALITDTFGSRGIL